MSPLPALLSLVLAAGVPATPARHRFGLDDLARLQAVSDPQLAPDGAWVVYVVESIDEAAGREQQRYLDGEVGRPGAGAAHLELGGRQGAALQPGRQVDRVPFGARRSGRDHTGLLTEPRGRRAGCAHRRPGRRRGVRLVARRAKARADRRRSGARGCERRQGKAPAHCHRSLSVQAGLRRLPDAAALAPISLRSRHAAGDEPHARRDRRAHAHVVAGRLAASCS